MPIGARRGLSGTTATGAAHGAVVRDHGPRVEALGAAITEAATLPGSDAANWVRGVRDGPLRS